ncbi:MAG TPA: MmcQ/YjbR family DNA-binding protein [Thermomicrobiales bacterium]
MVTFDEVRAWVLALPGAEEGTSYGTPAFRVRGKLLARLREEGDVLVVKVEIDYRDLLIHGSPEIYFTTPHYTGYPAVLVRLPAADPGKLREILTDAWRVHAPKRLVAEFDVQRQER